jgi:hypothetical protein
MEPGSADLTPNGKVFDRLATHHLQDPAITYGRLFNCPALSVNGKMFAMLNGDPLVVKLPAARCAELIGSGRTEAFGNGGRIMREWVRTTGQETGGWPALADEALAFISSRTR